MNFFQSLAWIQKLENGLPFSDEEAAALRDLPMHILNLKGRQDIVRQGDRPSRSCLLVDGFVCAAKLTGDGGRQITSVYVSGDMPDLQSLHLETMDVTFQTLVSSKIGFIPHEAIRAVCARFPRICAALWRSTLIDAAIYREWVANVGQRRAPNRLAHLLCEIVVRSKAASLTTDNACPLPMTQVDLSEALGMSVVHVNRTLLSLRKDGLITLSRRQLVVLDWTRLREIGDFDPSYLHLSAKQSGGGGW